MMNGRNKPGMTLIVKTVTRLTLGFILLYGIYVALSGHYAPGGGFAGGVIVALSFIHIMLAFGKEAALRRLHSGTLRFLVSGAALIFLWAAAVSFTGARMPFNVFNSELALPICEMVVVGGGLFAIFVALVLLSKADRDSE